MVPLPQPTFQLRRLGQLDALPGLRLEDLKTLADWAHLHPMDEVSLDGRTWIKVHEFKELGMVWLILDGEQVVYGPTSVGTLKEFFVQGEINADQALKHHATGAMSTVQEVIGDDYIRKVQDQAGAVVAAPVPPANRAERVRMLEQHLQAAQRELSGLAQDYRKAIQELLELRPGGGPQAAGFSH